MVFVLEDRASPTCLRLLTTLVHFKIVAARLKKAFDNVSHRRLVHKLIQAGFGGKLRNWLCSYLSGRRQRVTVLGATSEDLPVTPGVPQGSVLGPALFLLYVNDLPEVISSVIIVLMFADDTKIFSEIKTLEDASSLQKDLGKLATWSQSSGLLFNEAKYKAQHITRKTKPILSSYKLNNTALELYVAEKDLGVWISKDLDMVQTSKRTFFACS